MKKVNKLLIIILSSLLMGCNFVYNNSSSASNNSLSSSSSDLSSFESNDNLSSEVNSSSSNISNEIDEKFTKFGTFSEGIYGEFECSNNQDVQISYKLIDETNYKNIDKELIRIKENNLIRFDILGLKAGYYDVKVTSPSLNLESKNIKVTSYDRSGFAHYKNSIGVGAYNNDGTLKDNAKVIYVTNEIKNTVEFNGRKGLVNILKNVKSQTLAIRILDRIETRSFDQNSKTYNRDNELGITDLSNLTNKDNGDNSYWNMCNFSDSTGGLTIEGVGENAEIFQWGMTMQKSKYVEVRNLTFTDYPEDACAVEGDDNNITASQYIWIHNNVFNRGRNYVDQTDEQDKAYGDGATDIKTCSNVTFSYNVYNNCKKTGLVGGSDSQKSNKITFHHNYYNQCNSRLPLGRQATMHMYNNYYYKTGSSSLSIRGNGYAFVENCYFEEGQNPFIISNGGVIKSYNNIITATGTNSSVTVNDRTTTVTNSNSFNQNFDTDKEYFYYDFTNKVSNVEYLSNPEQVKIDVPKYAGILKNNKINKIIEDDSVESSSSSITTEINSSSSENIKEVVMLNASDLKTGEYSSYISCGDFEITANSDKKVKVVENNEFKQFDQSFAKVIDLGGSGVEGYRSIKFSIDKNATVYIYAKSNNSSTARSIMIGGDIEHQFDAIVSPTELVKNLSQGSYYVCSSNSGMSIAGIKIVY